MKLLELAKALGIVTACAAFVGACSSDDSSTGAGGTQTAGCSGYCSKCGAGAASCVDQCNGARTLGSSKCASQWDAVISCAMNNGCDTKAKACDLLSNAYAQCLMGGADGGIEGGAGGGGAAGGAGAGTGGADGGKGGSAGTSGPTTCTPSDPSCVACGATPCKGKETCCGSTCSPTSCDDAQKLQASCDGAEDCPGAECCVSMSVSSTGVESSKAACSSTCEASNGSTGSGSILDGPACHSSDDCAGVTDQFGVPYPECCRGKDYPIAVCVSQTFASSIATYGGVCGDVSPAGSGGAGGSGGSGGDIKLPSGCTDWELDCSPLTNAGCKSNETCDASTAGKFECFDSDGAKPGESCDVENGPTCAGTNVCVPDSSSGSSGTCKKYCCSQSDCGGSGTCTAAEALGGTLGACL